jgi:hypothetical protein
MKSQLLLLVSFAQSRLVFANMWAATECVDSPSAMFVFNMTIGASSMSDFNETWPPAFDFYNQELGSPGATNLGLNGGITNAAVCGSDLTASHAYQSASYDTLDMGWSEYIIDCYVD